MRLPLPQLLLAAAACVLGEQGGREVGRVHTKFAVPAFLWRVPRHLRMQQSVAAQQWAAQIQRQWRVRRCDMNQLPANNDVQAAPGRCRGA